MDRREFDGKSMRARSFRAARDGRRRHVPWYCHKIRTMTKKNIVRRIADGPDRTELETKLIVQMTLDAIINVLATEGRVELRNFGVLW